MVECTENSNLTATIDVKIDKSHTDRHKHYIHLHTYTLMHSETVVTYSNTSAIIHINYTVIT